MSIFIPIGQFFKSHLNLKHYIHFQMYSFSYALIPLFPFFSASHSSHLPVCFAVLVPSFTIPSANIVLSLSHLLSTLISNICFTILYESLQMLILNYTPSRILLLLNFLITASIFLFIISSSRYSYYLLFLVLSSSLFFRF